MKKHFLFYLFSVLYLSSCSVTQSSTRTIPLESIQPEQPQVPREFRAAWVATVANINWPSKPGLSTEAQQKEALLLLDLLQSHHFNAVIFQVRPQADALYESNLEPWSYFLTGVMGKAPDPYYDPLRFWVKEAHKRGLELHVWLNPYRAHHTSGKLNKTSTIYKMPESVVKLKQGYWWFDPGKKSTQDHGVEVVMDIVKRYDIDGVHFDDYFYPYASYNGGEDFPDSETYQAYVNEGGELNKNDWRRANVNQFIERVYKEIKKEKKHVKFGISPFGIWRPGHPPSIQGMDQYEELYADAKRWINKGWVDYLTPQLYWTINQIPQSFPILLKWWKGENTLHRHLWPGINVGRGGDEKNSDEVINQIMISRAMLSSDPGTVHWSIGPLLKYPSLSAALLKGPYKQQALVPASPWLSTQSPPAPKVDLELGKKSASITIHASKRDSPITWILYLKYGKSWTYKVVGRQDLTQLIDRIQEEGDPLERIEVSAINRFGNESERTTLTLNSKP